MLGGCLPPHTGTSAHLSFFAQPWLSEHLSLRGGLLAFVYVMVDGLDFLLNF